MKKAILFLALTTVLCSFVFAEHEVWFSAGHERAFFVDTYRISGEMVDTQIVSSGANLSAYRFFGGNIGIFAHSAFLFPQNVLEFSDEGLYGIDLSQAALNMQCGSLIGIAFRFSTLTNDLHFYIGVGLNIFFASLWAADPEPGSTLSADLFSTSFGIGTDIGLKFDITDRFFIKLGCIITFDFLRFYDMEVYDGRELIRNSSGRNEKFLMFGVRPYIAGGVNLHFRTADGRQRIVTGKPN